MSKMNVDYFEEILPISDFDIEDFRNRHALDRNWHIWTAIFVAVLPPIAWYFYGRSVELKREGNFEAAVAIFLLIMLGTIVGIYLLLVILTYVARKKVGKCKQKKVIRGMVRAANEYVERQYRQAPRSVWVVSVGDKTYDTDKHWPEELVKGEWVQLEFTVETGQMLRAVRINDPRVVNE